MNKRKSNHLGRVGMAVLLCVGLSVSTGCQSKQEPEVTTEVSYETFEESVAAVKNTIAAEDGTEVPIQLNVWYSDEAAAPYYEAAAVEFHDRYGVEVSCTYMEHVNYLESVNEANISGMGPDVFMASNDEVKKLHMAGLAQSNMLYTDDFWGKHYPDVAKAAVTSDGVAYGYPIYLDTAMMIYDTAVTTQPDTFNSITEFAVNFVDETNTKVIFRWDLADPFYDCLFLGTGAEILGEYGEDTSVFNVNNEQVVQNMTFYQSLHEYFSIDVDSSSYQQVKEELTAGTLVYGIVRTDVLNELGTYGSAYALCPVPPLSPELPVQTLSVTYTAFVNPFTKQSEYANLFAAFLSYEFAPNQFGLTRQVSVRSDMERTDGNQALIYEQYCHAKPVPKALENGDFWVYTEICFKNIWNGSDVAAELNQLQEEMKERLN